MPKYDDFGRPIYETAEEYNQAHRNGICPRTYDTSQKSTYTSEKKTFGKKKSIKKSTILIIGVSIYFAIMLVILAFNYVSDTIGGYYESRPENEYEEDWIEEDWMNEEESYGEYLGNATTPLPEGFEMFTFEGQTYRLPMSYQEVAQMGFILEDGYDEDYMIPTEYEELIFLMDEDGYTEIMIGISNYTDEEISLGECPVHYFYIENPVAYDEYAEVLDFVFGDGLTFESTYEELEAYFGTPYYRYVDYSDESYTYESYEWAYYGNEETHFVCVTFLNGVMSDISIEKRIVN